MLSGTGSDFTQPFSEIFSGKGISSFLGYCLTYNSLNMHEYNSHILCKHEHFRFGVYLRKDNFSSLFVRFSISNTTEAWSVWKTLVE